MPTSEPIEFTETRMPNQYGWVIWNVTSEVDALINGGIANYGWMLRDYKKYLYYGTYYWFYTSDSNNDLFPRLFVWFEPS
jgi:hypothetical protein